MALTRGLARRSGRSLGNFWVDVVRCTLYVLLPICFIYTLFLVWQGVPQNLNEYTSATTLEVALGWLSPTGWVPFDENVGESLKYLVMPAVTLGVGFAAPLTRFLRSGMLDVMGLDYMRTARSKGLPGRHLVLRHALKNALLPVVTVFGLFFGGLLGGAVLTESVFSWPGLGRLLVDSIEVRDYGVVQGVVLFVTLMFALVNLVVDLSYAYLDPRIRFEG